MKLPEFSSQLFKNLFSKPTTTNTAPEPDIEQMKKAIDTAMEFDKIVVMPGWEKAMKYCVAQVNSEIAEATKYKYEPTRQSVHVVRWDAKRELLDGLMGYIEASQRERDNLIEMMKVKE